MNKTSSPKVPTGYVLRTCNPKGWPRLGARLYAVLPVFFIRLLDVNVSSQTYDSRNLISRTRRVAGSHANQSWVVDFRAPSIRVIMKLLWIKGVQPFGIHFVGKRALSKLGHTKIIQTKQPLLLWIRFFVFIGLFFLITFLLLNHTPSLHHVQSFGRFWKHLLRLKRMVPFYHIKTVYDIFREFKQRRLFLITFFVLIPNCYSSSHYFLCNSTCLTYILLSGIFCFDHTNQALCF